MTDKPKLPNLDRFAIPETPTTLRARIQTRLELLRGVDPDSWDYVRGLQRVRELELRLTQLERGAVA